MNATQGLVKAYRIDGAAGVGQYIAVVHGATDGNCKIPTAANAAGFLGFTIEGQTNQYKGVAVQKNGIARAKASGAITRGDRCNIADNTGKVASVETAIATGLANPAAEYNVIGRAEESAVDGQIFAIWILPETVPLAVS